MSRWTQKFAYRLALTCSLLALNLCADVSSDVTDVLADVFEQETSEAAGVDSQPSPSQVHEIIYRLGWNHGDIVMADDGNSWHVVTDLGYEVTVTRAYILTYSIQLADCPQSAQRQTDVPRGHDDLLRLPWWGSNIALAGHGSDANLTTAYGPHLEAIHAPKTSELVALLPSKSTFCNLHYLAAPPLQSIAGLEPELDLSETSLWLEGSYRAPDSSVDVPFNAASTMAHGALLALSSAGIEAEAKGFNGVSGPVVIVIRRNLSTMFHGIDFGTASPKVVSWRALDSLMNSVELELH